LENILRRNNIPFPDDVINVGGNLMSVTGNKHVNNRKNEKIYVPYEVE